MGEAIATLLILLGGAMTGLAMAWGVAHYPPLRLSPSEELIARQLAFLLRPTDKIGRWGQFVLTNQRLLWSPAVVPRWLGWRREETPLSAISSCEVGKRILSTYTSLVVTHDGRKLVFHFSTIPIRFLGGYLMSAAEWRELVLRQRDGLAQSPHA